jgi:hypothetical protein
MALLTGEAPAQRWAGRHDDELAALIVLRDGHTTYWRAPRLAHDLMVDAWERRALLDGDRYAVLFMRELIALRE